MSHRLTSGELRRRCCSDWVLCTSSASSPQLCRWPGPGRQWARVLCWAHLSEDRVSPCGNLERFCVVTLFYGRETGRGFCRGHSVASRGPQSSSRGWPVAQWGTWEQQWVCGLEPSPPCACLLEHMTCARHLEDSGVLTAAPQRECRAKARPSVGLFILTLKTVSSFLSKQL